MSRVIKRITFNMSGRAYAMHQKIQKLMGWSNTETLNHSAEIAGMVLEAQENGGGVWIQHEANGELTKVMFH